MARDNRTLGRFHLDGLPAGAARRAADRGHLRHRRQRHRERDGQGQGDRQGAEITISGSSGLGKDDVERMVKDAEAHAAEDKSRREVIDLRNQADALAYEVEKTLAENRDRVPAS